MTDYKYEMYNIYNYYDGPLTFTGTTVPPPTLGDRGVKDNDGNPSKVTDAYYLLYFEYDDEATEQFGEGFGFWKERVYRVYRCGYSDFEYARESEIDRSEARR